MRSLAMAVDEREELQRRNRVVLRVLLGIVVTLLVAGLLVGIRW